MFRNLQFFASLRRRFFCSFAMYRDKTRRYIICFIIFKFYPNICIMFSSVLNEKALISLFKFYSKEGDTDLFLLKILFFFKYRTLFFASSKKYPVVLGDFEDEKNFFFLSLKKSKIKFSYLNEMVS